MAVPDPSIAPLHGELDRFPDFSDEVRRVAAAVAIPAHLFRADPAGHNYAAARLVQYARAYRPTR